MLADPNQFGIEPENIGRICARITVYSLPFSIAMTFLSSYLYEILGRKITIFASFLSTTIVLFLFPYTAPNYNYLVIVRIFLGVTMAPLLAHPLIADYI